MFYNVTFRFLVGIVEMRKFYKRCMTVMFFGFFFSNVFIFDIDSLLYFCFVLFFFKLMISFLQTSCYQQQYPSLAKSTCNTS